MLSTLSEELEMFIEVGNGVSRELAQATARSERLSPQKRGEISGRVTENVIRDHLLKKGLNMSRSRVRIAPSWLEIDLLVLKPESDSTKSKYSAEEVDTILEIKNNAVGDQTTTIKKNFNKLKQIANKARFAVIVLSERDGYKYAIKQEELGYPVFTLISRKVSAGRWMWSRNETLAMHNKIMRRGKWGGKRAIEETGKWEELLDYLHCNRKEHA